VQWRRLPIVGTCLIAAWFGCSGAVGARRTDNLAVLTQQISELQNAGKYPESLPLVQRLMVLSKARYGEKSVKYADALDRLADIYFSQSQYTEAEPIYAQVLTIRKMKLGPRHENVLATIVSLADLYRYTNRPQMGEPLLREGLAERERAVGPIHPSLADALRVLAEIELALQHYSEAETHILRAIPLFKKGKQEPTQIAQLLGTQAEIERSQLRFAEAERSLKEALSLHEKADRTDPNTQMAHVFALMQLVRLYQQSERDQEATIPAERALDISEKVLGPDNPNITGQLEVVATLYEGRGRYPECDALRKRALTIIERAYGSESINFANSLKGLGVSYGIQGRDEEALALLLRALEIAEKSLGTNNPALNPYLADVGARYLSQRRYSDAELFLTRALASLDKAPPSFDPYLTGIQRLGIQRSLFHVYRSESRYPEAKVALDRALAVSEQLFGPDHSQTGEIVSSLAFLLLSQDKTDEAERLFERALPITARAGKDDVGYASNIAGLSMVYFKREDWAKAYAAMRSASAIFMAVDQRVAAAGTMRANTGPPASSISHATIFSVQAFTAYYLAKSDEASTEALREEAFQMAQRAQSSQTAAALGQMAARFSSGTGTLAVLVRERQDLGVEWQALDARFATTLAAPPAQRNQEKEQALRQRLADIAARLDALNARFAKELPEYAALANPQPLTIADAQKFLLPREALVLIAGQTHESLVWVIAKDAVRWTHVPLGEEEIAREVAALRCGLDYYGAWEATGSKCAQLLNVTYSAIDYQLGKLLPFDLARAHTLYKALFGEVEDLIKDKHLLVVPSSSLTQLPFHVLVTEKPETPTPDLTDYRNIAWFARSNAITVLPAVASLQALRQYAKLSQATKPLLGVGNPLLDGPGNTYADLKQAALERQSCGGFGPIRVAENRRSGGVKPFVQRGGIANVAELRMAPPLPETAEELCNVAKAVGAAGADIFLGARASEREIKQLSEAGILRTYRIVHFATHGALAGQVSGSAEPGLLLTPPVMGTEADDGYLSASEIAGLKLDADWVILSACNTGAGGAEGAEALSGLARAFFYAGARALLVSHWAVDSESTVKLITTTVNWMSADKSVGRAEALRRSMLSLMDQGKPHEAHPAYWAPFVVVGEGGSSPRAP
jgi:CHAT domain-containing protein